MKPSDKCMCCKKLLEEHSPQEMNRCNGYDFTMQFINENYADYPETNPAKMALAIIELFSRFKRLLGFIK